MGADAEPAEARAPGLIQRNREPLQARVDGRHTVKTTEQRLEGEPALVVGLLYGSGRHGSGRQLMEALRLRVRVLDVQGRELSVRNGKGGQVRLSLLPKVRHQHQGDLAAD